jgi:hypothetical protein
MRLSDFMIRNPQLTSFQGLLDVIGDQEKHGKIMLQIDLKPEYPDTPRSWEIQVENAFTWGTDGTR